MPVEKGVSRAAMLMQSADAALAAPPQPLPLRTKRSSFALSSSSSSPVDTGAGTGLIAFDGGEEERGERRPYVTPATSTSEATRGIKKAPTPSPEPAVAVFNPPPSVPAQWASTKAAALEKLQTLYLDAYAPDGGTAWKVVPGAPVNGVRAYGATSASLPNGDPLVGARGDSILPYSPADVLRLLVEDGDTMRFEMDAGLDKCALLTMLSPQVRRVGGEGVGCVL